MSGRIDIDLENDIARGISSSDASLIASRMLYVIAVYRETYKTEPQGVLINSEDRRACLRDNWFTRGIVMQPDGGQTINGVRIYASDQIQPGHVGIVSWDSGAQE